MKKLIFYAAVVFFSIRLNGQDITISFQPKEAGVQIDSVWVNNLKTDQKVKLLEGESLMLTKATGLELFQKNNNDAYLYSNPLLMEDVLVKFPKLRINIMHAGVPAFTEETFAMFYMFPNVYADIGFLPVWSNYMRASMKQLLLKAIDYGFIDRIMFGSDAMRWPSAINIGINYIKNADYLTETQKQDILYNNAARFLKLSK
jgi:predicted TIM-barrel fold metal-dependent hydrolase